MGDLFLILTSPFILLFLIFISPVIIYFILIFSRVRAYLRTKDKASKKAILHTLLYTYDLGLFTTMSLLLLAGLLSLLITSTVPSIFYRFLAYAMSSLLLGGGLWYIIRIVLGVVFLFKYRSTKNIQQKKILQQKMDWGFKGFLLIFITCLFYYILVIYFSLFMIGHDSTFRGPKFTP